MGKLLWDFFGDVGTTTAVIIIVTIATTTNCYHHPGDESIEKSAERLAELKKDVVDPLIRLRLKLREAEEELKESRRQEQIEWNNIHARIEKFNEVQEHFQKINEEIKRSNAINAMIEGFNTNNFENIPAGTMIVRRVDGKLKIDQVEENGQLENRVTEEIPPDGLIYSDPVSGMHIELSGEKEKSQEENKNEAYADAEKKNETLEFLKKTEL